MKIFFLIALVLSLMSLIIYRYQHKLIFFPEVLPRDFVFTFNYPFEEIFLKTEDNSEIHGLFFHAKKPKGVVLYFHGNAGSLRTWGQISENFLPFGYSILIMDYRGYGKSSGSLSEKKLLRDSQTAYDFLKSKVDEKKIIIYGRSIGTGVAVYLATRTNPRMLILESPFTSLVEIAKFHYPFLPSFLLKFRFFSNEWIGNIQCPAYLFHGAEDAIIPIRFGENLAKMNPGKVKFIRISHGGHNDLSEFPEYWENLRDIIGK